MDSTQYKLPPNPSDSANFLSNIFSIWLFPFFKKGYEKVLTFEDMFKTREQDKSELLGNRLETNWNQRTSKRNSLLSTIIATFWKDYALLALLCFVNDIVFRLGQQFLLGLFLQYFGKDSTTTYNEAVLYGAGIVVLNGLNALTYKNILDLSFNNGMKVRLAVCSLIYRKALRLSQTALGETSPGKVVNLLSNDVNRFEWATFFINNLWIAPLLTSIVGYLIWTEIGYAGLVGIFVVFMIAPMMSYAGKLTSKFRLQTAILTDERIRFMDEIISGVQVIKMYAWEKPFTKLITYARKMELKVIQKTSFIRAVHMSAMLFTTRLALFFTMLAIVSIDGPNAITPDRIFVISGYFSLVSHVMSQRYARGIAETAEVFVALGRLESFLHLDEKKTHIENNQENGMKNGTATQKMGNDIQLNGQKNELSNSNIAISMKNATACWTIPTLDYTSNGKFNKNKNGKDKETKTKNNDLEQEECLTKLNIDFPNGKLIGVIGTVGSGKSSLLQAILRELPLKSGTINVNGSISYACQEAWVFGASVKQNILFGEEYDRDRYNAVIRTCALEKDFEQLENGDRTIVGERGMSLSGGQKARINLARACYRKADIYLLDDPLSAVDAHVGTHIFEECIGPKSRLAKQKATRILVSHQVHFLKEADWIIILKDGEVKVQGTLDDLYKRGVDFVKMIGITETPEVTEVFPVFSRQNSVTSSQSSTSLESMVSRANYDEKKEKHFLMENFAERKVKGSLLVNYLRAGTNCPTLFIIFFAFIFAQFLASAVDYFVSIWTKQEMMRSHQTNDNPSFILSTEQCIYIQGILLAAMTIFGIARLIGYFTVCVRSSQNIHNFMFNGIISTTMRFFESNPSGRILNKFSKDLGEVDENFPKSLNDTVQTFMAIFGTLIVTSIVNPYFLIPTFILMIIIVLLRKIYLKTSKNVKRLEGAAKSPVYTHIAATLNGLTTVRAYKVEEILKREFDNHQDTHTTCYFMGSSTVATFGFCLDIVCTIFICCSIFYYILFDQEVSNEKIGLVVSQAIGLSSKVSWAVRQSADVDTRLVAIERVLEYRDLESEKQPEKPAVITSDWPSSGCIEFRNVFYRYFAEAKPVLQELSFVIKPKEKIGIVGRTGAGKSSLIGALFRL
ncbi:multidrug resistance-associated protein 4-like, partial [Contarinia nasturtii]|uniref:multidrug resistance-associated protein 4-like n=1 Tax=Contarinia nasturtii TaxID=265458 RepID=UPI0012D47EF0